ncbi:MAG: hypothetical protein EOP54_07715 [Sphingobacteriales bacterium]|nr:MAG: hypothetical protein EOP54_07715 [Sphingobacteriales bacterium]
MNEINPNQSLYNDLVQDWQEQKAMIKEQIKLIDPMATSLRKSTAQRFLSATLNVMMEILMYLLAIGSIAYLFFLDNLGPFYILGKITSMPEMKTLFSGNDLSGFAMAIKGLFVLVALLFFTIGRMLANIRHKNATLSLAGKNMKTISGQHLARKTEIEILEQRHIMVLPQTDINVDSIEVIKKDEEHNDILL